MTAAPTGVCIHCGGDIELDDGTTWFHVESMEPFCEPNDPNLARQADPDPDPPPNPMTPDALERWLDT